MFVHLRGEEFFIISQTNPFSVKPVVLDSRLSIMDATKAEFAVTELEYAMDQYNGAPCHDYSFPDVEKSDFDGFKECSKVVIR